MVEEIRPTRQPIMLSLNTGILIRLPKPARTVYVADAEIADVQVQSADAIYVTGKKEGQTTLYAADDRGDLMLNRAVQVKSTAVTIIRRGTADVGGQPTQGPTVLQIPLQPTPSRQ